MEEENVTYIKTLEELAKYENKLVVCFYYKDYNKEHQDHSLFRLDEPKENIGYMWIMRFESIPPQILKDNSIRDKQLKYKNGYVCLVNNLGTANHKVPSIMEYAGENICSAQSYIRTPTKEEIKIYMNMFRHRRIFGN